MIVTTKSVMTTTMFLKIMVNLKK